MPWTSRSTSEACCVMSLGKGPVNLSLPFGCLAVGCCRGLSSCVALVEVKLAQQSLHAIDPPCVRQVSSAKVKKLRHKTS